MANLFAQPDYLLLDDITDERGEFRYRKANYSDFHLNPNHELSVTNFIYHMDRITNVDESVQNSLHLKLHTQPEPTLLTLSDDTALIDAEDVVQAIQRLLPTESGWQVRYETRQRVTVVASKDAVGLSLTWLLAKALGWCTDALPQRESAFARLIREGINQAPSHWRVEEDAHYLTYAPTATDQPSEALLLPVLRPLGEIVWHFISPLSPALILVTCNILKMTGTGRQMTRMLFHCGIDPQNKHKLVTVTPPQLDWHRVHHTQPNEIVFGFQTSSGRPLTQFPFRLAIKIRTRYVF